MITRLRIFHAEYGDAELIVGISPIRILVGQAAPRVRSMVIEWAGMHQPELAANWERCRTAQLPERIRPLE